MEYDPKNLLVVFAGIPISGFAEGTFVEIKNANALWAMKVGADGFGIFSKSNNFSASTIIRLMPGCLSNQALSLKLAADRFANLGFGPLEVFDKASGDSHTALRSRIMKAPDKKYAVEVEVTEWEIGSLDMISNYGALGALTLI